MVVGNTLGAAGLLRKYLESDSGSDLLAEMVKMAAELLMDAEVDVLCGAGYGERTEARLNSRNGHRKRRWDTRAGTIELEIPKLRTGSYFPGLLEPRRRAEQALVSVVCQAYVEGVSTRRVDDLVRAMGIEGISKSQVSELAKHLDAKVAEFCNRPLDAGPYTYVWVDALLHKVREGGRVVSVATVIATGVNADGHREVLGVDVFTTEDGAEPGPHASLRRGSRRATRRVGRRPALHEPRVAHEGTAARDRGRHAHRQGGGAGRATGRQLSHATRLTRWSSYTTPLDLTHKSLPG